MTDENHRLDHPRWKLPGNYIISQHNQAGHTRTDNTANTASDSNEPIYAMNQHDRAILLNERARQARQEDHTGQGREHKSEEALMYQAYYKDYASNPLQPTANMIANYTRTRNTQDGRIPDDYAPDD